MIINFEISQKEIENALRDIACSDNVRSMVHEVLIDKISISTVARRYDVSPAAVNQNVKRVQEYIQKNKFPDIGKGQVLVAVAVPSEQAAAVDRDLRMMVIKKGRQKN